MIPADPERALVLAYAPKMARRPLAALWRLDERLGEVVATTRDDRIGAIRLAWWREALEKLDVGPPPAEPMLQEAATELVAHGLSGRALSVLADGWAALLEPAPLTEPALRGFAEERGAALFVLAGQLLGVRPAQLVPAGEGWALVDLAFRTRDPATADAALVIARIRLGKLRGWRWPRALRSLGALTVLAAGDGERGLAAPRRPGAPCRVGRALLHRATGY